MDAAGEFDVQALFDRLEKIHHQMMGHVESAQRQHVLVVRPLALDQRNVQAFLFEEPFFDGGENRRLTSEADVADAYLHRAGAGIIRLAGLGMLPAAAEEQGAAGGRCDQSSAEHKSTITEEKMRGPGLGLKVVCASAPPRRAGVCRANLSEEPIVVCWRGVSKKVCMRSMCGGWCAEPRECKRCWGLESPRSGFRRRRRISSARRRRWCRRSGGFPWRRPGRGF